MLNCRFFNGYKPCGKSLNCNRDCKEFSPVQEKILIVHLEALGAVLRATSILPAIKRKYPNSQITWVTQAPAHHLLQNIKSLDRVFTTNPNDLLQLRALNFDFAFCLDKSLKAVGVLVQTQCNNVKGFVADGNGVIVPANIDAIELWELGLSNELKFFKNTKTENQLLIESLSLGNYQFDTYQVCLTEREKELSASKRWQWGGDKEVIVGLNTGCSPTIPYKKLSVQGQRELIRRILANHNVKIVLLGGPEDTERNIQISEGLNVICSDTEKGLRDGLTSVEACDVVVSGDSLGMHMAIGLKKYVVAWFGPTCSHEIELYGRGEKVLTTAKCSPCWSRSCHKSVMCYDLVNLDQIVKAIERGIDWQTSLFKPPFLATSFSPSPL